MFRSKKIQTPLGEMLAIKSEKGLCMLEFFDGKSTEKQLKEIENLGEILEKDDEILNRLENELNDYFKGNLKEFTIPLDLIGTDFQKKVWNELIKIPFGETRSYKEQSIAVGDLLAIRAVANANGKNKIAIVVPCHRVIGSDGSLTGYAGGKKRKQFLLELESQQLNLF
ncbi:MULTISPECIES: methylated-DNA--[protein]-cysteine S-methyltransferase [Empedobacter]|uniref:Methylated-DNA--protein-cysteine methyltransferase n=1 Tax=Empedobacter falsenii TaxID=343874 RepID=A0A7H9DUX9_9FLAO|nr:MULTISPECIES: methylated-DNA--[protein]-cysteine S-methyltransferase [Empedobacter]MDH0673686.1 methylated-DNA--[protein]-cysteine S-methyltransferase [Empedobacter sp. GD03861]MDH2205692.1 methylated-DNA--[protein]-cysteine S-methyltransferase [Empedobacter sp. GD03644]QLL59007.1 methylated-DNA--[protein]-cysteine S-methyltransferase [Empedobacter falsenii]